MRTEVEELGDQLDTVINNQTDQLREQLQGFQEQWFSQSSFTNRASGQWDLIKVILLALILWRVW